MAATTATASTSRESAGAGYGVGTGPVGEGAEASRVGTDGEITRRPRCHAPPDPGLTRLADPN